MKIDSPFENPMSGHSVPSVEPRGQSVQTIRGIPVQNTTHGPRGADGMGSSGPVDVVGGPFVGQKK
jgi:hypothetical protein